MNQTMNDIQKSIYDEKSNNLMIHGMEKVLFLVKYYNQSMNKQRNYFTI